MRQLNTTVKTPLLRLTLCGLFALSLLLPSGCHSDARQNRLTRPRPDQEHWLNEAQVNVTVQRLIVSARLASCEPAVRNEYAALLRYWHAYTSASGRDLDGGRRALNYIRMIHFNSGGNDHLWHQVMQQAQQPDPERPGLAATPIPTQKDRVQPEILPPSTTSRREHSRSSHPYNR